MLALVFYLTLGLVSGMDGNGTNENINLEDRGGERNPFEIFNFGLGVVGAVGEAVGAGVGAVGGAVDVVGGAVGVVGGVVEGALDAVGDLPRNIPPIPNPFLAGEEDRDTDEKPIERALEIDNTTTVNQLTQTSQFCRKDPVDESLEEVLSNIGSVSKFFNIYVNSNLTEASDFDNQPFTVLAPNNQAVDKLSPDILERLEDDVEFAKQFVLKHSISAPICCWDILRNSGPFFNSNRKGSLGGTLITLRRTVSGGLYADKSEIDRDYCNTVFNKGTLLTLDRVLGF